MKLALLSTAQHVSDVNTSIFGSLRLFAVLCKLTSLGYHITNRQSRSITPARLKSAYTTQQIVPSS